MPTTTVQVETPALVLSAGTSGVVVTEYTSGLLPKNFHFNNASDLVDMVSCWVKLNLKEFTENDS